MFNSGITVETLIESVKSEADIAPDVPEENYMQWINAFEQMLYSEIIKEQDEYWANITDNSIKLKDITQEFEARFEDVVAVYATKNGKTVQLKKSTLATGDILPNCYFKVGDKIFFSNGFYNKEDYPNGIEMRIIYTRRPKIKTKTSEEIMLPIEFIELMKSKVRGEAYKLANEDALAAKWLNDYNVLLENFKIWISNKSPSFGI